MSQPLGPSFDASGITVRVFAPRTPGVDIELFREYGSNGGVRIPMISDGHGVWTVRLDTSHIGSWYGFRVAPIAGADFMPSDFPLLDPYARFVSVRNTWRQDPLGRLLPEEPFDWEGDTWVPIEDPRDLVIYETHVKDATRHSSAGAARPGTYAAFTDPNARGGMRHIKRMGANAVEFLPLHLSAYHEPPYGHTVPGGVTNLWNPYAVNHWGYMTTSFFAPEPRFVEPDQEKAPVRHSDPATHRAVKQMVKRLHAEGLAVILDVVYNHVSQYDRNPLKYLDKGYYFRLNPDGSFLSESGCGNDFRSEMPMARQLILDSIRYWAEEFHIDGFRFDLGHLLDRETLVAIRDLLRTINPHAVLIAEPWGGGYNPVLFSDIGWSTWNDQIRNGVKGSDPVHGRGYIFGEWHHESVRLSLENYLRGTLLPHVNGRYHMSRHSLNYLESHDGYTLGDFIRIGLNPDLLKTPTDSRERLVPLSADQKAINRLGALFLFLAQGIPMIHAGQEWARTKWIEDPARLDGHRHKPDHNSYEKDDATNHLDYRDAAANADLVNYYAGLIRLRKSAPAWRRALPEEIVFTRYDDALHITGMLDSATSGDPHIWLFSLNGNPSAEALLPLPDGYWDVVVTDGCAGTDTLLRVAGSIRIPPSSGTVLRKLRAVP